MTVLPTPTTTRWQPLRLGLVDLFYYDSQEFRFRDGRLLLRGNNGTGKSKVLALTLPFLLDGDLTPSRIEPDGDRNKRMEWNLLLGGEYEERTGYSWLELGRVAEDGERCYLTVGCGLKAVSGRGIADRWYFVTSRRIGDDLALIGPAGTVLTRDRLTEAVGEHGQVTQRAEQYRRILDEHLFHLGRERYDALITLLIQLRQPQLSKQPKEELLSKALSEALAPLDQALLADIAASFHDLEQQREELAALRDTRSHVGRFLTRYRHYARVAARRAGRELRSAQSTYDEIGRQLGAVREEIGRAGEAEAAVTGSRRAVLDELVELNAAREELVARPELKSLDDARRLVEHTDKVAAAATARRDQAAVRRAERQRRSDEATLAAERTRSGVGRLRAAVAEAAAAAGVSTGHDEALGPLALPDGATEAAVATAERALGEITRRRRDGVAHVIRLAEESDRCRSALTAERRRLGDREEERDAEADRAAAAADATEQTAQAYLDDWRRYASGATELRLPLPDELDLAGWASTVDGENPAVAALRTAQTEAHHRLAEAHVLANQTLVGRLTTLDELVDERRRLEAGQSATPPAPYTRTAERGELAGAPLWRVVDFAANLSAADRAGLEAALESSGLLDAWVTPDGSLLDPDTQDVLLTADVPAPGRGLTTVLCPTVDTSTEMSPETVSAVLAGIGYGESDFAAWVEASGRWRLGPLRGAWTKLSAEYVGAGAREQARRRRLAVLTEEITAAEAEVAAARSDRAAIEARQRTLADEVDKAPSDDALRDAHRTGAAAARALAAAQARVAAQREAVMAAVAATEGADTARDEAALALHTPTELPDLRALRTAVEDYRTAVVQLLAEVRGHVDRLAAVHTWADELSTAEHDLQAALSALAEADEAARDANSRLSTLESSIGATVAELTTRLADVVERIRRLDAEAARLGTAERTFRDARVKAEGREEALRADLERETDRRNAAVRGFQRFARTGLLATAAPELDLPATDGEWAADPSVRLARRAEQQLSDVDDSDEAWRRAQDDIARRHAELAESLSRHGHHAVAGLDDGLFVATVQFQGRARAPGELVDVLDSEVAYRDRMLTAKERELIEEHLINDVASTLQELISDAEQQLTAMNAELADRPTSTGMRLRLRWEPRPDGPAGLPEARARLLRQHAELWSPEDRAAVGDFLQVQIETERNRDEFATWGDQLRRALDYRAWHRFVIERWQDGRWRPATGPASGGERVLAASLPLFAAASAHYRSAHPHAPRLVLLDEAFAGVDDDARAKCLGLLAQFDLDVVMTSEREWGFYATVPGIATHQLVRRDGIDGVHVTTWEWDGAVAREVDQTLDHTSGG